MDIMATSGNNSCSNNVNFGWKFRMPSQNKIEKELGAFAAEQAAEIRPYLRNVARRHHADVFVTPQKVEGAYSGKFIIRVSNEAKPGEPLKTAMEDTVYVADVYRTQRYSSLGDDIGKSVFSLINKCEKLNLQ